MTNAVWWLIYKLERLALWLEWRRVPRGPATPLTGVDPDERIPGSYCEIVFAQGEHREGADE
jgi:hypothetical protein